MSENTQAIITTADRSVKAIVTATTALSKVVADLNALNETSTRLSDDIQQKESQIANLDTEYAQKIRTKNAELNIAVLESEDVVLSDLMQARGLARISKNDLDDVYRNLVSAKSERTAEIEAAVASAVKEANAAAYAKLAGVENTHKVQIATLEANSASATDRIAFLTKELENARAQIEAERNTRLEIAKAEANRQGFTINNSK